MGAAVRTHSSLLSKVALSAALVAGVLAVPAQAYGVAGGSAAADRAYPFMAKLDIGGVRSCSGALVDPEWILTAASCFAEGGQPVPAGPPAKATKVTVGRSNVLSGTDGQVRNVVQLVPRTDRDLALAKLASAVPDVTPARIRTTKPVAGDAVRVAGFGRTAADWVPDRMHSGTFSVQTVSATWLTVVGNAATPATVCKGDAGGPAFREVSGGFELVAVNSRSYQSGCFIETETRQGAIAVRVDDMAAWVAQTVRGGNYTRLAPSALVLDTRNGTGAPAGKRGAGSTTTFPVLGVGGVPSSGVSAVLIDLSAVAPSVTTVLTAWPDGETIPANFSTLVAGAGQILSNSAVVRVGANGRVAVRNASGTLDIAADVQGYFTTSGTNTLGTYVPVAHTRLVDTRSGIGGSGGAIPSGGTRTFTLTGGVIPAGSSAAMLDVIVTGAGTGGWLGTFPPGTADSRSVMDYLSGTTSTAVTAKLATDGRVTFSNHGGSSIHLVLTAEGYFIGSTPTAGADFRKMTATRVLDTRTGGGAPLASNGTVDVQLGLPATSTAAALVNLTVVSPSTSGFLLAWPVGGTEPTTSLVNYPMGGYARSSLATVATATDGKIRIKNISSGTAHVLVEVLGWFAKQIVPPLSVTPGDPPPPDQTVPTIVEEQDYPNAAQILAARKIKLIKGDGHITLADCGADPNHPPADLVLVQSLDLINYPDPNFCFKTKGSSGYLTMEINQVYLIRGEDVRTIAAKVETFDDPPVVEVKQVVPQTWVPVGIGESRGDATVLELRF